jgi:hypothetical protein
MPQSSLTPEQTEQLLEHADALLKSARESGSRLYGHLDDNDLNFKRLSEHAIAQLDHDAPWDADDYQAAMEAVIQRVGLEQPLMKLAEQKASLQALERRIEGMKRLDRGLGKGEEREAVLGSAEAVVANKADIESAEREAVALKAAMEDTELQVREGQALVNAFTQNVPGSVRERAQAANTLLADERMRAEKLSQMDPRILAVRGKALSDITPEFRRLARGDAATLFTVKDSAGRDPYGTVSHVPNGALNEYDFNALPDDKVVSFLSEVNIAKGTEMPPLSDFSADKLESQDLSNGIPPVQHSIWVGGPLTPDSNNDKHKNFLAALARNKQENSNDPGKPQWQVVLWTDQKREDFLKAPEGSDHAKMMAWAKENDIIIANIDEVFCGKNAFQLNDVVNLERNKAGTGRAAVSDIIRLELVNRFGGVYVDGDKPVNVKLDAITQGAAENTNIRMVADASSPLPAVAPYVPLGEGERGIAKVDESVHLADGKKKIVMASGFAVPKEHTGETQNCAICATRGNVVIQQVISNIQGNYQKGRKELGVLELDTPQRKEILGRTGPSAIQAVADPLFKGNAFMPKNAITTSTGVASWSQEGVYRGIKNPALVLADKDMQGSLANLEQQARGAIHPAAPLLAGELAPDRVAAVSEAVKKSLTSLAYTVPNEGGRLDLNHLTPHIEKLVPTEQALAIEATLQSLQSDQFAPLKDQISSVRLNKSIPLSENSMDTLLQDFHGQNGVDLMGYTLQEAIVENNHAFLNYAVANHLVQDLAKPSSEVIDPGLRGNKPVNGKCFDALEAAVMGGDTQALILLSSLDNGSGPLIHSYPEAKLNALASEAALNGQVTTVAYLAQKTNRPELYQSLHPSNVDKSLTAFATHEKKTASRLNTNADTSLTAAEESHLALQAKEAYLAIADRMHADFPGEKQLIAKHLDACATYVNKTTSDRQQTEVFVNQAMQKAESLGLTDELLKHSAGQDSTLFITAHLNKARGQDQVITPGEFDAEAEMAVAQHKFPNSEVGKNDFKDFDVSRMTAQKVIELTQKALVYSQDRLRADASGSQSRIDGWSSVLNQIKASGKYADPSYSRINSLIDQAEKQLRGINHTNHSVRDELRNSAKQMKNTDLSQRTRTSAAGRVRDLLGPHKTQQKSPEGHSFVPGKGMH